MSPNAFEDNGPLFSEDDVPMFELEQRVLDAKAVEEMVKGALKKVPPDDNQAEGIKRNIEKLEQQGLWATARFYRRLLEEWDSTEG